MQFSMNKIILTTFLLTICLYQLPDDCLAREEVIPHWETEEQIGQPLFTVKTYRRINPEEKTVRIDVVSEISYDMLMFVRTDTTFSASIELSLSISRQDVGQIDRLIQYHSIIVNDYESTNSRSDFLTCVFLINLLPEEYDLQLQLHDKESKRRETVRKALSVSKPTGVELFDLSDLVLARSSEEDHQNRLPSYPTTTGLVPDKSSMLFCYFDVYRKDPASVCKLELSVLDKTGAVVLIDSLSIIGGTELNSYFIPVHCEDLSYGRYKVVIQAEYATISIVRTTFFNINFHGLPSTINELDQAINQLKYIADEKEIKILREEFTSKKEQAFINFWNKNFPAEGEKINGKMIEYFNRIGYANERFSGGRDGWETDRGMIYIIYGAPDETEQHAYESNSAPYELWYYHQLGKRFLFRDDYGFGDYRLVSPVW